MRTNTIIALGVSAVFGVGAVFLARGWIQHAVETEVQNQPRPVAVKRVETVPVLVASGDVPRGVVFEPSMVKQVEWPKKALPEGYFESQADLFLDPAKPPVALMPLSANEPILPFKFSGPGGRATLSVEIAEGKRAYTIQVDEIIGVAGFVLPGDAVDVLLVRDADPNGDSFNVMSDVILQNVRVLGVDQLSSVRASEPRVVGAATLEVSVEQAQRLAVAYEAGRLALMLRRSGSEEEADTKPLLLSDLGGPLKKTVSRTGAPTVLQSGPGIIVRRGTDLSRVSVVTDTKKTGR